MKRSFSSQKDQRNPTHTKRSVDRKTLLNIMQLSDSFFPAGMYTASHGLETLFYQENIKEEKQLKMLIKHCLRMQTGVADCVALGNTIAAAKRSDLQTIVDIDRTFYSLKLVKEPREASVRSGIQLLNCMNSFQSNSLLKNFQKAIFHGKAHGTYPVALGIASSLLGLSKHHAALILLYTFCVSFIGAALRLGIIDHKEGQIILHDLKPTMIGTSKNANKPMKAIWQFFPALDIAQMQHERLEQKMFVS